MKDFYNEECELYVAESSEDGLNLDDFPDSNEEAILARNKDLQEKFESVLKDAEELREKGIDSFEDLRKKYENLFNSETDREFKLK